jgi:hypothetical protein
MVVYSICYIITITNHITSEQYFLFLVKGDYVHKKTGKKAVKLLLKFEKNLQIFIDFSAV